MASARPPAWVSKRGAGRVMAEFKALSKDIAKGGLPGVTRVGCGWPTAPAERRAPNGHLRTFRCLYNRQLTSRLDT